MKEKYLFVATNLTSVPITSIVERAKAVFENTEAALSWLQSPNTSLGGVTPLSLLDTNTGVDSVLDTLGKIEHGVFS